jgi:regulator of RNase E activity RraA
MKGSSLLGLATLIPAKETHTVMLSEMQAVDLERWPLSMIESAVARIGKRAREEGVALPGLAALWEGPGRVSGYAVTVTMSTQDGFPYGRKENIEWWRYVESRPGPKVVVAQVLDGESGQGAACGVLSAHVLRSLGCAGFLTDGYVRDVEQMRSAGLMVAARGATLRHGNPHVVRFGGPVEVFGMKVSTGDFVMAGGEGAIAFPAGWLAELPPRFDEVQARVEPVLKFCRGQRRAADEIAALMEQR